MTRKLRAVWALLSGVLLTVVALTILASRAVDASPLSTDVSGHISADTTWTLANSPYVLTGDVIVDPGVTLTIQAGVVVQGRGGVELQVQGHLQALGTTTQPITFTSETDSGPNEWAGLVFDGGTGHLRAGRARLR